MAIDLKTIDEKLAKAREDLAFWENLRSAFLDPRVTGDDLNIREPKRYLIRGGAKPSHMHAGRAPYGEIRKRVLEALPPFGQTPLRSTEIADAMVRSGYVFKARTPSIAVNGALVALGSSVHMAKSDGLSKLWTLAPDKDMTDSQDQQQTPP